MTAREEEQLRAKVALAYGFLWHINTEPGTPAPMVAPERASYEARKALRDVLSEEERGAGIEAARLSMSRATQ